MNARGYTYRLCAAIGSLSCLALCSLTFWIGDASAQEISRGPYLQSGAPTSMVIRWRTTEPAETRLEYRASHDSRKILSHASALTTDHEVKLTGLAPQTRYYYTIRARSKVLAGDDTEHFFVTSPNGGDEPTRVWLLGDAGISGRLQAGEELSQASVRDAFLKAHPEKDFDVVAMLGDNAYDVGSDEQYQRGFFGPYRSILRSKVVWPTQGNHDHSSQAYYRVYSLPTRGESGGVPSGTERYYSFNYGNAHFISLNSEIREPAFRSAMIRWLRHDLAANTKPWTIAFWHHPPYSKGHHDSDDLKDSGGRMAWMRETIVPILDEAGVDIVFTGHSHSYERSKLISRYYSTASEFAEKFVVERGNGRGATEGAYSKRSLSKMPYSGTVFVTAGSAGTIEHGPLIHPAMVVSEATLGSVFLVIDGNEAIATMVGADGETKDSFTIRKEPDRPRAVTDISATFDAKACAVTLAWRAGPPELAYVVYRSSNPYGRGEEVGRVGGGLSRFVDKRANAVGGSVWYSVRATNARGVGPWGMAVPVSTLSPVCSSPK